MSRASGKFDMEAIKLEYITGPDELSIRELARRYEASFSHFAKVAREAAPSWEEQRREYRSKQLQVTTDAIINQTAVKVAQVKTDALDVIHAAILKMGLDLQDRTLKDGTVVPGQVVTPSDMAKLLDRLMPLVGQPNNISENRNLGIDLTEQLPPDVARLLADIARERGSDTGAVGRARLPGDQTARNN